MNYQVLARKYRPQRFADVIGQQHATVTLMNALTQGRVAHGYIFSGHRGIGKTTVARIVAMALNCRRAIGDDLRPSAEPCGTCESCIEVRAGNSVDVIEIDAATNRGIDEIRELRDAARYRPARDPYKIYILDEAHQITDAAFNALLKTLEEPPEHIVFMMATTQPEDIPQTVRSRCQHFSFRAVRFPDLVKELRSIAKGEEIEAPDAVLNLIAEAGDGSVRDALSVMDQTIASASVDGHGRPVLDVIQVREMLGTVSGTVFERMLDAVRENRASELISTANELIDSGNSAVQIARQFVRYLRSTLLAKISDVSPDTDDVSELLQLSLDEQRRAARSATAFSEEDLTRFLQIMLRTFDEVGYRQEPRLHLELGLLKLLQLRRLLPFEQLLSQLPSSEAPTVPVPSRGSAGPTNVGRQRPLSALPGVAASPKVANDGPRANVPPGASPGPDGSSISFDRKQSESGLPEEPIESASLIDVTVGRVDGLASSASGAANAPPSETAGDSSTLKADDLRAAAVDALLAGKNQRSAADALGEAHWKLEGDLVVVQTDLSKRMLGVVLSADVQSSVRSALVRQSGRALRLEILPAAAGAVTPTAAPSPRTPRAGSAESRAVQHPIVQEAQRLFNAEIRNVIDLSHAK